MTVNNLDGKPAGQLKKVMRKSPTLGAKPPKGAVVLFDGTTAEHFTGGKMTDDGLLMQGVTSKQTFGSHTIHIEFLLPYMPEARGQGRANSGFYAQGRYETQMLDSFGLEGKDNECGGIYKNASPRINMCFPPLSWQTYDVDFTAAQYQDGKKVKNAMLTVRHNGVLIHENQEISNPTTGGPLQEADTPGPVFLQNHGNPVRYRNIWLRELPEHQPVPPADAYAEPALMMAPDALDRYVGRYGTWTIRRESDRLQMNFFGPLSLDLIPHTPTRFSLKHTAGTIEFDLDADGAPTGLTFHLGGTDYPARKVE
jgi:hypothetical protein